MKIVKNTSMQGIYVAFETSEGVSQKFIAPKSSIQVPDSWGGRAPDNMIKRRMLRIHNVPDPITPTPQPPKKTNRKSK